MPRINPDFSLMRTEFDGFKPEKNRPSRKNIRALGKFLTFDSDDCDMNDFYNWDQVIAATYERLAFFRKYYCSEDLPGPLLHGGVKGDFVRVDEPLGKFTHWQRQANEMSKWADRRKEDEMG